MGGWRGEGWKRDSRQGVPEGKTGGSSPGRRTELWSSAGLQPPTLRTTSQPQEQVLQDSKSRVLMHSFILRNKKRFDHVHKLMNELT